MELIKIIVVDDEAAALHVFLDEIIDQTMVQYHFFKDDEKSILEYARGNKPNAAFLDIKMPNADGLYLAQKLIEILPDIKIVFITGLNVRESDLPPEIAKNTLGFIYKPYDRSELVKFLEIISEVTPRLYVTMFDTFECFKNGRVVEFSSSSSKELFALLLVYNGKTLTMSDAISQIWGDHDVEKAKSLYRDASWRMKKTLEDINFPCIDGSRAEMKIIKDNISCDYWDYLEGKNKAYHGEFLKNYDWSIHYLAMLDDLL